MVYQLDRILKDVRIALDQNGANETLLSEEDESTLSLDELIRSKVLEAVDYIHTIAPYRMLDLCHSFSSASSIHWKDKSGWLSLPGDFLRLVVFKMSDWDIPVYTPIATDNPKYSLQRGRIAGLKGNTQKPVCALVSRVEGLSLEFYSCKDKSATIEQALYIPIAAMDNIGCVDISEKCYPFVVYKVASLTLASSGEAEKASMFNELSNPMLSQ